jgi:hypothetical protein
MKHKAAAPDPNENDPFAPLSEGDQAKLNGQTKPPIENGQAKPNGHAKPPIEPLPTDDPFAAGNFAADGESVPAGIDDVSIEIGAPSDEEFVYVSSDPRHTLKANLLVVKREDGYGKSFFLLTPAVAAFCKSQPSLKKFVKLMRIFLYVTAEGAYGLWLIRDSLDNWSVSDLGVVQMAKKNFTRRYTDGKVRKGHTTTAIPTAEVQFPDKNLTGSDGILKQAFGEAFAISTTDQSVINRLLGK